ncbi:MAG TPA: glycine cleavage system aminomethyltransferase GcvT [Streptosporangiaceae bacterium]|nr:glycine cleavage system aminomethyltransferase GcvT [Streptosporangiaceae bacterium]
MPESPSTPAEAARPTPLLEVHQRLGATLTSFAGWLMPLRYGSETAEHHAVRRAAGMFDLSHMGEITVTGPDAGPALDYALTGLLSAVPPGRARYTMMCAEDGGVVDDLVVYRIGTQEFLVVANASNTATVDAELRRRAAGFDTRITDRTADYALIAIQGPAAAGILAPLTDVDVSTIRYYAGERGTVAGRRAWVARTGYTGEDGFEIFCQPDDAEHVWTALTSAGTSAGLAPAGLAARDTLRLEAGMPLYGNELGPDVTPYDAGLGRVVKFDKPGGFVGAAALAGRAKAEPRRFLAGLTVASRRVPRHGYTVLADGRACGAVTSGAPSPTLGVPIAMAYLEPDIAHDRKPGLAVDIRGRAEPANLTELPFYRRRPRE